MARKYGPTFVMTRATRIQNSWKKLRPRKAFAGLTLSQFGERVLFAQSARDKVATLRQHLADAMCERNKIDCALLNACELVTLGVKADPSEGDDSKLIPAFGSVTELTKEARKNGAGRRKSRKKH